MSSIFGFHDRSKFEVIGFSTRRSDHSEWRQKIQSLCDEFYDIPESPCPSSADLAQFIYSKNIQILFNLNGWTTGHRTDVFVLRPAPIQISYMGFCGTMGADYIDYIITDKICSPPEALQKYYVEQAIYMPNSYFVTDYKQSSPYCL